MRGGGAAGGCDVAMLLLFAAARCERTFQTTHKRKKKRARHGSACMQAGADGFGD